MDGYRMHCEQFKVLVLQIPNICATLCLQSKLKAKIYKLRSKN